MKSHRTVFSVTTETPEQIIDITGTVARICTGSGVRDGLVLVFPLHTSAAVYLSDSDHALTGDFSGILSRLVPSGAGYRHDETDHKRNADGHMKANLAGHHVTLPLTDGAPDLGTYQTVYYAEFDGCREKEILVKIIGE